MGELLFLEEIKKLGLFERRGKVWVSSRDVARKFEKEHKEVLKKIRNLVAQKTATKSLFYETTYIDGRGKEYPEFIMNKKGFSLLAMRFTGDKALDWQIKYVDAFEWMEEQLRTRKTPEWQEARVQGKVQRRDLTDILMLYVDYSKEQGSKNQTIKLVATNFTRVANEVLGTIGVLRDQLSVEQLRCLDIIEMTQANAIYKGMENSVHYKKIFQDMKLECKEMYERFLKPSFQRKALTQSTMPFLEVSNG